MATRPRFVQTTRDHDALAPAAPAIEPALVLAFHPSWQRIGQLAYLRERVTQVCRLAPEWEAPDGAAAGPLDDPFVSRTPFEVWRHRDDVVEIANPNGVALTVDGVALGAGARRRVAAEELRRGVCLALGERALLLLTTDVRVERDDAELPGLSRAMAELRQRVRAAAATPGPFLVTGETGAGKELVARALHAQGPRFARPFVAVNVAAISQATAAAELFGHERGAFTGAEKARPGVFASAHGGTLFLDEIGELPEAIAPMLLRALEGGEIQPVGGQPRAVDVVVIAATDADLEAAASAGRFRRPLYYRLAATCLAVPPLRERRVDIPLLLARFVAAQLPAASLDRTDEESLFVSASVIAELLDRQWPGNVRELRSVAARLATAIRAERPLEVSELGAAIAPPPASRQELPPQRKGAPIDDDALVAALRAHRFALGSTARALGVSRSHLDALIERSARVRKAKDLGRDEILACRAEVGDDLEAMAARLEVSPRGLALRIGQLGV